MTPTDSHRSRRRARRHVLAAALACGLVAVAAACSGGSEAAETTPPTTDAPTTTRATTTTSTTSTAPPTTPPPTEAPTTVPAPIPRMPLTGTPLEAGQVPPDRPALVVKMDNVGCAHRTQVGLNLADIVYEEIVESRLTRFAAVFHSQSSNPVGPIRSGRSQDVDMLGGLNRPLLAWSGGNPGVNQFIAQSDLIDLSMQRRAGGYYRSGNCGSPHNLFNTTDALWAQTPPEAGRPTALFQYVDPGEVAGSQPASFVDVNVGVNHVRWDWVPEIFGYVRTENGRKHIQADGTPVSTNNVVVLVNQYRPTPWNAKSPEAISVGTGDAYVFTGGNVLTGTWTRFDRTSPIILTAPDGTPLELNPGRTFIEMADVADHGTTWG